ncbi:MAG: exodeoxyribonuclease III [Bacteroidetes bacterium]|nr:MAG: exodeoxyribonuclease III [Bacteroidota bacterium]
MKVVTYNVNGIRAALKKGWFEWFKAVNADFVCLQEVKAQKNDIEWRIFEDLGYQVFWQSAEKKGYSGVAIFAKSAVDHVEYGCGIPKYDFEGRVLRVDTVNFSLLNVYMPSGSSGEERQQFKFDWLDDFEVYIDNLKKTIPKLIICGDYNICHQNIDIHNPSKSQKASGFLPAEREWFSRFLASGFTDSFRYFNSEPHHYTWWSVRSGARKKNLGWRIDHQLVSNNLVANLNSSHILSNAEHSDHCPVLLEMSF